MNPSPAMVISVSRGSAVAEVLSVAKDLYRNQGSDPSGHRGLRHLHGDHEDHAKRDRDPRVRGRSHQSRNAGGSVAGEIWDERTYRLAILYLSGLILCIWPVIEMGKWIW